MHSDLIARLEALSWPDREVDAEIAKSIGAKHGPSERPPLEMVAFAAWVNVEPDNVPASFRAPTCDATMQAWRRVAAAISAHLEDERIARAEQIGKQAALSYVKGSGPWKDAEISLPDDDYAVRHFVACAKAAAGDVL